MDSRGIHLGTALVPTSTPRSQARTFEWRVESLAPNGECTLSWKRVPSPEN